MHMETRRYILKSERQQSRRPARREGQQVESEFLKKLGLVVYVPSVNELRAKSDIIQPFRGQALGEEFGFRCTTDVGTALVRLIVSFGLPNAPEYHDWSKEFMDFRREGTYWEYIFEVNDDQYLFVSHDAGVLTVGSKTTPDKKTCEAFCRFVENAVNKFEDSAMRT